MAVTGLSIPVFGKYANNEGAISYSQGKTIGHAISYNVELTTSDDNPLYGDNMIVENDTGLFQSGTLTFNTSELTPDISKWLLTLSEQTFSFTPTGATSTSSVTEYVFDDNLVPIYLGFGVIEQSIVNGATKYQAVILPKVKANIPPDAANTRGQQIEWQTKELTFQIYRDDSSTHKWKIVSELFSSEDDAIAYLNAKLGVGSNS